MVLQVVGHIPAGRSRAVLFPHTLEGP